MEKNTVVLYYLVTDNMQYTPLSHNAKCLVLLSPLDVHLFSFLFLLLTSKEKDSDNLEFSRDINKIWSKIILTKHQIQV
jgi:hypothetical protein